LNCYNIPTVRLRNFGHYYQKIMIIVIYYEHLTHSGHTREPRNKIFSLLPFLLEWRLRAGEYPLPRILHTADTFFQLSISASGPASAPTPTRPPSVNSSSPPSSRLSYELWVVTGSGERASRPNLSVNPLDLQQNVSFANRSLSTGFHHSDKLPIVFRDYFFT